MKAQHTPGPWKVMACPIHAGKHHYHDQRWIATADVGPELDEMGTDWHSDTGSLICEMRDGEMGNAPLIAAAPELLDALEALLVERYCCGDESEQEFDAQGNWTCNSPASVKARAAIAKAKGLS
jgi:hypothetical protein